MLLSISEIVCSVLYCQNPTSRARARSLSRSLSLSHTHALLLSLSHTNTDLTEIEICSLIVSQYARGGDAGDCGSRAKCTTGKGTLFC